MNTPATGADSPRYNYRTMKYLLAALVLLILAGAGLKIMNIFTKNTASEIVETRDFRCDGMEGFTFKYPVFKGWEVKEVQKFDQSQNECRIRLRWPYQNSPTVAPTIIVTKDQPHVAMQVNSHGIRFEQLDENVYFFNLASFSIRVTIVGVDDKYGFFRDLFWQQVIESFRVVDKRGSSIFDLSFNLDFHIGGSITGPSFRVTINSDGSVKYIETTPEKGETKRIEKVLTQKEFDEVKKTINEINLFELSSQDFSENPILPDQGTYFAELTLNGEKHEVSCGLPPGNPNINLCQKQMGKLTTVLNEILGVSIY